MPRKVLIGSVLCLCLYLYALTVWRLPAAEHQSRTAKAQARQASNLEICGFPGNSDIYGLGIRLGTYLQWLAALISKQYIAANKAEVLRELLDVNNIFCLAIFVATLLLQVNGARDSGDPAHAVELLILLHIYFGNTYIISYEQLLRGKHGGSLTFLLITSTVLITAAMSCYAIYYWFYGLDRLLPTECGTFAFLFAKVELFGRARTFFKFATVVNMVPWGAGAIGQLFFAIPMLLFGLVEMVKINMTHFLKVMAKRLFRLNLNTEAPWRQNSRGHIRSALGIYTAVLGSPKSTRPQYWFGSAEEKNLIVVVWKYISSIILVFSILAIELILRWNSVTGVYNIQSTGQVIPFVIGLGGLCKVLVNIIVQAFDQNPVWNPRNEAFRLENGRWATFPRRTPKRRYSWAAEEKETNDDEVVLKRTDTWASVDARVIGHPGPDTDSSVQKDKEGK